MNSPAFLSTPISSQHSSIHSSMARQKHQLVFLFSILTAWFLVPSLAISTTNGTSSSCSSFAFPNNQVFTSAPIFRNSIRFSTGRTVPPPSTTLRIAYRHGQVSSSTWVAWGINPTSTGMVGTQAIVAYQRPDGTVAVYTSPVDSYNTQLQEGALSFPVSDFSALFLNDEMVIFAVIQLPENTTIVNHVWQDGPVSGNDLGIHDLSGNHLQSMGTLNLSSGQASASQGGINSKIRIKNIHGVLNTVSWGIMMSFGFMAARYLKAVGPKADPLWFYIHIVLQLPGFLLGIAGGATGLYLSIKYSGVHQYPSHLYIGITLLFLGTLQVSALFLRLAKDHRYRHVWNWFHHLTSYAVLLLSVANIWIRFFILKPAKSWLIVYGVVLGELILSTIVLEVWKKLKRDRNTSGGNHANKARVQSARPPLI